MEIKDYITNYATQPITHQLLTSIMKDYKRPNDKIKSLRTYGLLQSFKKVLYVAVPKIRNSKPENRLVANFIYGPKCSTARRKGSHYLTLMRWLK